MVNMIFGALILIFMALLFHAGEESGKEKCIAHPMECTKDQGQGGTQ